ncbi:MAG: NYN domain-containing protein [Rhodobacteraceae bacterium]|nr:NYN domain-containing protein [Paracoccaceae bacterium]
MTGNNEPKLAVLIDGDNIPAKYAEAIFEEAATFGEISMRRVYGDFSDNRLGKWNEKQVSLGIVAQHVPSNSTGKNATDIALVIDAIDFLHSGRYEGFFIVSSDGDFTRLAHRIREEGKDVYGIGEEKAPAAFRNACKRFIFVDNLISATENGTSVSSLPNTGLKKTKKPINHANQLIENTMRDEDADGEGVNLGYLGQALVKRYPDFDFRSYGEKNLKSLMLATGKYEVTSEGGNLLVKRKV